jgi:hypothetical protein
MPREIMKRRAFAFRAATVAASRSDRAAAVVGSFGAFWAIQRVVLMVEGG